MRTLKSVFILGFYEKEVLLDRILKIQTEQLYRILNLDDGFTASDGWL